MPKLREWAQKAARPSTWKERIPTASGCETKMNGRGGRERTRRIFVLRADLRIHGGIELEESVVALLDAVRPEGGVGLAEGVALVVATETGGTQSELWDACGRVGRSPPDV